MRMMKRIPYFFIMFLGLWILSGCQLFNQGPDPVSFELNDEALELFYKAGAFNFDHIQLTITYDDDSVKTISLSEDMLSDAYLELLETEGYHEISLTIGEQTSSFFVRIYETHMLMTWTELIHSASSITMLHAFIINDESYDYEVYIEDDDVLYRSNLTEQEVLIYKTKTADRDVYHIISEDSCSVPNSEEIGWAEYVTGPLSRTFETFLLTSFEENWFEINDGVYHLKSNHFVDAFGPVAAELYFEEGWEIRYMPTDIDLKIEYYRPSDGDSFIYQFKHINQTYIDRTPLLLCENQTTTTPVETEPIDIALITDSGSIHDMAYNQAIHQAIVRFSETNDYRYQIYHPTEISHLAFKEAIDQAVLDGAHIIFLSGFLFEQTLVTIQYTYPEVTFVILDGIPYNDQWEIDIAPNTLSIMFKEADLGFLAGYVAVKDGYQKLGFIGGLAVPPVVRFGLGYIAGAYYAAFELGLTDFEIHPNDIYYINSFSPSEELKAKAKSYYNAGIEVIFSATGGGLFSIILAAEETDAWVITPDHDHHSYSAHILFSTIKDIEGMTYLTLAEYFMGTLETGIVSYRGIKDAGVFIPLQTSRLNDFDWDDYEVLYTKVFNGDIMIPQDIASLSLFLESLGITSSEDLTNALIGQ